jgi:hypothetical protein
MCIMVTICYSVKDSIPFTTNKYEDTNTGALFPFDKHGRIMEEQQ